MLLFWATACIGSQFFGSISAITLGIPGEASSLIYIDKVRSLSSMERNQLLWLTSRGSLIGGIISLLLVGCLYHVYNNYGLTFLATVNVKVFLLWAIVIMMLVMSERKIPALLLAVVGLIASPRNNYSLPVDWFQISQWFQNSTFFMMIVGLLILPDFFDRHRFDHLDNTNYAVSPTKMPWWVVIKNSIIGCVVGLIPGPAAETAASTAYLLADKNNTTERIVAAETANNPGVVMMLLPLFLLGLPFTASSLIVSNIMDGRMVNLVELGQSASSIISGFSVFDSIILMSLVTTIFFYIFSIRFINFYSLLVKQLHSKLKIILAVIILVMIGLDAYIQEITIVNHLIHLGFFVLVGLALKYMKVNPIPFIFVYLLGDQIVWATTQFLIIHF
jgi:putative tricarboxylic transport membrane protein